MIDEKLKGEGKKEKKIKVKKERKVASGTGQSKMISEYGSQNQASLVKSHRQDERTAY
jgi:hypothetical protein